MCGRYDEARSKVFWTQVCVIKFHDVGSAYKAFYNVLLYRFSTFDWGS